MDSLRIRLQRAKRQWRRRGQSLTEFAILLPLLLVMLSGLIEFGFLLNDYLDLIDAAREVARFAADEDPLHDETGAWNTDPTNSPEPEGFYTRIWTNTDRAMTMGGQLALNPATDDVVVSLFSVNFGTVSARYPLLQAGNGGENGWTRWGNHTSNFSSGAVQTIVTDSITSNGGALPPNTGVVMVEVFYDYNMLMGLPWITAFVPNPVTLHAYSFMPNSALEPTPTP
ncbi:MAG TPA: TadE/TadG family type IV pilus assembly protein [Anaerolineales bacterium]